jgi:transcriptional regulator with PAS, ATPase and Fis domain
MKSDLNDLKKLTLELIKHDDTQRAREENEQLIRKIYGDNGEVVEEETNISVLPAVTAEPENHPVPPPVPPADKYHFAEEIEEEETLSLQEKEIELIKKSLERNKGKRKAAAAELGISERTLYRKIKQYDL